MYETFGFALKYGLFNSPLQISEIKPMGWADDNGVSVGDNLIFVDVFDIPEYDGPLDGGDLETLFELQRPLNITFRRLGQPRAKKTRWDKAQQRQNMIGAPGQGGT